MIPWQQNNATWENNFVGSVVATKRVTAPSVSSIQGQVGLYNVSEDSPPPRVISILRLAFRPSLSLSWAPVTGTMEPEDVSPMPLEPVLSRSTRVAGICSEASIFLTRKPLTSFTLVLPEEPLRLQSRRSNWKYGVTYSDPGKNIPEGEPGLLRSVCNTHGSWKSRRLMSPSQGLRCVR